MSGKTERDYKLIQRFLKVINPYPFLSHAIGLLLGEAVRHRIYGVREQTVFCGFFSGGRKDGGIFILQDFFANYHTENIPC